VGGSGTRFRPPLYIKPALAKPWRQHRHTYHGADAIPVPFQTPPNTRLGTRRWPKSSGTSFAALCYIIHIPFFTFVRGGAKKVKLIIRQAPMVSGTGKMCKCNDSQAAGRPSIRFRIGGRAARGPVWLGRGGLPGRLTQRGLMVHKTPLMIRSVKHRRPPTGPPAY